MPSVTALVLINEQGIECCTHGVRIGEVCAWSRPAVEAGGESDERISAAR